MVEFPGRGKDGAPCPPLHGSRCFHPGGDRGIFGNPNSVRYKKVIFGRSLTLQILCDSCDEWQFDTAQTCCSECGKLLNRTIIEEVKTEYRTPIGEAAWLRHINSGVRKAVYERDDFTCQYCETRCFDCWITDKKQLTLDHRTPFSGGGGNEETNLVTCCRECNSRKGNRRFKTFEEARAFLAPQNAS